MDGTKPKSRLGRGLSSLISVAELPVEADVGTVETPASNSMVPAQPAEIPLDEISPNPHQPRRHLQEQSIANLAASLKSTGLIQPIIVRKVDSGYQLIAGERRWRAAKMAGF